MIRKILLFVFFIAAFASAVIAQKKEVTIKGKVIDKETGEPMEYATLVLVSANEAEGVSGGISDLEGNFNIKTKPGTYDIRIEFIAYEPYVLKAQEITKSIDLGTIEMAVDAAELGEVVVVGEKTTVEVRLDKKIYNVG
ncbi:MAG: carboxypeptidase-like regulatory domain-containing protein, partial [Bacteroidota bacterium]